MFKRITATLLLASSAASAATLTVHYADQAPRSIQLADGTRLAQFYTQQALPGNVNWQTALITTPSYTEHAKAQGDDIQEQLYSLQNSWRNQDGDYAIAAWYLAETLKSVDIVGRIRTDLDPDRVRLFVNYNRPLVGQYSLYLTPYTETFSLFGLINLNIDIGTPHVFKDVKLKSGWSVDQYVQGYRWLPGADKNYGYLISGTGTWRKVPLAIWNRKHIEPAAGETLFVGFDPRILPENMSSLNDQIADYLANRIPH
ncbi:capsule biosynthesis GfcC family protein [Pectobacteriaceae bacterium CE90]|nr:capsule biosynthesis GfcC family protein [Pectobacteriaceae bacterium CE90]